MIHQYKLNDYNIVLDTCSGSIHAVDEVAYDIIAMFKDETKENIIRLIIVLKEHGHISLSIVISPLTASLISS